MPAGPVTIPPGTYWHHYLTRNPQVPYITRPDGSYEMDNPTYSDLTQTWDVMHAFRNIYPPTLAERRAIDTAPTPDAAWDIRDQSGERALLEFGKDLFHLAILLLGSSVAIGMALSHRRLPGLALVSTAGLWWLTGGSKRTWRGLRVYRWIHAMPVQPNRSLGEFLYDNALRITCVVTCSLGVALGVGCSKYIRV